MIKSITIVIAGQELSLTLEEVRELKNDVDEILKTPDVTFVPTPLVQPLLPLEPKLPAHDRWWADRTTGFPSKVRLEA